VSASLIHCGDFLAWPRRSAWNIAILKRIAAAWAIVGAVLAAIAALVVARVRGADSWAHPPAG
jgi:hypothetical protein